MIAHTNIGTADVAPHAFMYSPTQRVFLLDTPGFDDTTRSDTEVLKDVATFLSRMYAGKIKLSGIIYLHRITDNRMSGSAMRNLNMFKKLCGENYFQNVVLATTMWERLSSKADGLRNEEQLKANRDWWGGMLAKGSRMFQHYDSAGSAREIVGYLVKSSPTVLRIQEEMVDERRELVDTLAGREVEKDLHELRAKCVEEMKALRDEQAEALKERDETMLAELRRQEKLMKERIEASDKARKDLQVNFERLARENEAKYLGIMKNMREENRRVREEAKQERERLAVEAKKERERLAVEAKTERNHHAEEQRKLKRDMEAGLKAQAAEARREREARANEAERERKRHAEEQRSLKHEMQEHYEARAAEDRNQREAQARIERQRREQEQKKWELFRKESDDRYRESQNEASRLREEMTELRSQASSRASSRIAYTSSTIDPDSGDERAYRMRNNPVQRNGGRNLGTGASLLVAMAGVATLNPVLAFGGLAGAFMSSSMQ